MKKKIQKITITPTKEKYIKKKLPSFSFHS